MECQRAKIEPLQGIGTVRALLGPSSTRLEAPLLYICIFIIIGLSSRTGNLVPSFVAYTCIFRFVLSNQHIAGCLVNWANK